MNALVINHCAHNKGDRAVLAFVTRELSRNGATQITVSCSDPKRYPTGWQVGCASVTTAPYAWNPGSATSCTSRLAYLIHRAKLRAYRHIMYPALRQLVARGHTSPIRRVACNSDFVAALDRAQFVISTGGHHLSTDFGPDGVWANSFDIGAALASGKPLALWSQTFGPFKFRDPRNREFTRSIVLGARCACARDASSVQELVSLGIPTARITETCESVLGLSDELTALDYSRRNPREVGIAIYCAVRRGPAAHERYVAVVAAFTTGLLRRGLQPVFFPMELQDSEIDDRPCIRDILARVEGGDSCRVLWQDMDTMTHIKRVAGCSAFVGHKTHSVIFSLLTGTPLLAIAYHPKTADFQSQYGLSENCIDDSALTEESLTANFDRLWRDRERIAQRQREVTELLGARVRADFALMLARLRSHSAKIEA